MDKINLTKLSATVIAKQIWECPNIKNQIRELFLARQIDKEEDREESLLPGLHFYRVNKEQYKNYELIINSAVLNLNLIELPIVLKHDCEYLVRDVGVKIYEWCEYVTETLEFDLKFTERIYWLPG